VGGTAESVTGLGVDTVRLFHDRWYRPPNMVIAVAGPVDHAQVVDAVSRRTVGRPGAAEPVRRDPPGAAGPVFRREDRDSEQSHLVVGVRAFERTHPDREALDVVNHVLGGGMSSRLFQQIREERGLAYAVHSGTWFMQDSGALSVYAGTMPEHVPTVLGLIDAEMDRIAADGVTDEELEVAIGCLTGSFVLGLEDTGSRMWRVGSHLSTVGEVRTIEDQVARWREVTGEQVRRVAASVLGGPRVVTVVGDAGVR
jgi:predicted Zn-dependent peptidase